MTLYLIYAASGSEFEVEADLRDQGVNIWCGRVLEGKPDPQRGGRKRLTVWDERPVLPNYLFAEMTDPQWHEAREHKHIRGHVTAVHPHAARDVARFKAVIESDYAKAEQSRARGEMAPPVFTMGQALEAIGGPLSGLMLRYRGIVEGPDGFSVVADADRARVEINPAHVRAAS